MIARLDARLAAVLSAVVLFFVAGARSFASEDSRIIIDENFESYASTEELRAVWTAGTGELLPEAPGGGKAASHDGSTMNKHAGFIVQPDALHDVVLSVDFYDFATNTDKRVTVSLNNSSPDNLSMGINSMSSYVVRAAGFSASTNWVPFKRNHQPVSGWHRFRAVLSVSNLTATLDLNADGQIDRIVHIPLTMAAPKFTQLRFGGLTGRPSKGGPVLVDNIKLEIVPIDPAIVAANTAARQAAISRDPESIKQTAAVPAIETPSVAAGADIRSAMNMYWWILAALSVIILLLFVVLVSIRRQGPSSALAPLALPPATLSNGPEGWRERALQAEALASKQARILEEKVGPDLVEFAKQALVQGLYSQRNALIETQQKAHSALAELELRLAELELPQPQRIEAYEKRIAELERELESRGEEMRELTRATLMLVRQKLEEERGRTSGRFN